MNDDANKNGRWFKSKKNRVIDGVCGGFAEYLHMDSALIRILWIISAFFGGIGIIAYLAAMIFLRTNPEHEYLNEEEMIKPNTTLIGGAFLFILGFFILINTNHLFRFRFPWGIHIFPFHPINWSVIWPLLIVCAGIAMVVYAVKGDKGGERETSGRNVRGREQSHPIIGNDIKRSKVNKVFGGVCGGFAERFKIDATLLRVAVVIAALATHAFAWVLIYIACMVFIPREGEE